jgi:hypothetical protein
LYPSTYYLPTQHFLGLLVRPSSPITFTIERAQGK